MTRLSIDWTDHTPAWNNEQVLRGILQAWEQNPFGPITQMDFNQQDQWQPYSHDLAVKGLLRGATPSINLVGNGWRGGIGRQPGNNGMVMVLDDANHPAPTIHTFIYHMATALPTLFMASASITYPLNDLYNQQKIPRPPAFMGLLGWYYLLSPQAYTPCFTKGALLQAPAYYLREVGNDWVEMFCYAHPLDIERPEGQQRVIAVSKYLRNERTCW